MQLCGRILGSMHEALGLIASATKKKKKSLIQLTISQEEERRMEERKRQGERGRGKEEE